MQRQTTEWKKVFASSLSGKWLISRIYKELAQLNIKNNLSLKMGNGPEKTFFIRYTDGQQKH